MSSTVECVPEAPIESTPRELPQKVEREHRRSAPRRRRKDRKNVGKSTIRSRSCGIGTSTPGRVCCCTGSCANRIVSTIWSWIDLLLLALLLLFFHCPEEDAEVEPGGTRLLSPAYRSRNRSCRCAHRPARHAPPSAPPATPLATSSPPLPPPEASSVSPPPRTRVARRGTGAAT